MRVKISLGSVPIEPVSVVVDIDIKLPPTTAVSGRGKLITKRKYRPEEGAEIVPTMSTNRANRTVRISKEKEAKKAISVRTIKRVRYDEQRKRGRIEWGSERRRNNSL